MSTRIPLQFMSKDRMVCVCMDLDRLIPNEISRHQLSLCKDYMGWLANHPYKRVKGYLDAALCAAGLPELAETTCEFPTNESIGILIQAIAQRERVCFSSFFLVNIITLHIFLISQT